MKDWRRTTLGTTGNFELKSTEHFAQKYWVSFIFLCYAVKTIFSAHLQVQTHHHYLYNDVNVTRAVICRFPWFIRVQIQLTWMLSWEICFLCFVQRWRAVLKIFVRYFRISKKFNRSYLQRRKMEKGGWKGLLTTWEYLNYKKSSQRLLKCVIATGDSLFCKMFSPLFCMEQKTLKNSSKKRYISKIKEKEAETKSNVRDLKKALTSTNPRTVKRYEAGMYIGLFRSFYETSRFHVAVVLFSNRSEDV